MLKFKYPLTPMSIAMGALAFCIVSNLANVVLLKKALNVNHEVFREMIGTSNNALAEFMLAEMSKVKKPPASEVAQVCSMPQGGISEQAFTKSIVDYHTRMNELQDMLERSLEMQKVILEQQAKKGFRADEGRGTTGGPKVGASQGAPISSVARPPSRRQPLAKQPEYQTSPEER